MLSVAPPRLAVRAVIVQDGKLLLVNAYPGGVSDLWCAPGGGVECGASLADNLRREVAEETGLIIAVGTLCHVSEFHNPDTGFHQVEMFFRAGIVSGTLDCAWRDPEGIVTKRQFFSEAALPSVRFKPDVLQHLAFGDAPAITPGALERMAR
ncbi:NUDIX domain-containing protein [Meridianimarinicoccus aquatilis]|uniref:NUDIX hydrolase n=1 Tax=Meridianimarinicoccus aquatilis TaxID=2552766 RepID=A0A4R6AZW2_9RHOB|nr:NUDIX hydrolase [Fluviibacterium aquatile]TDL89385.1 NUDIX hydrolase [Fluviibacterium aquatile]